MTPPIASLMAEYNRWMNERMYAAAATLDAATLAADKGAFFGSILGTLNHVAVADTIWMHRFARHEASFASLRALSGFPQPSSLTQPIAPDFAGLRRYRHELDALIVLRCLISRCGRHATRCRGSRLNANVRQHITHPHRRSASGGFGVAYDRRFSTTSPEPCQPQ